MKTPNKENIDTILSKTKGYVDSEILKVNNQLDDKQNKLTAGENITIDEKNVISASGGLSEVKANDIDSETATNGQVMTADGSGGASWQNASVDTSNLWTLDTTYQTLSGNKSFFNRTQNSVISFFSTTANASGNDRNDFEIHIGGSGSSQYPYLYLKRAPYAGSGFTWRLGTDGTSIYLTAGSQTYRFTSSGTSATKYVATTDDITAKVPDAPSTDGTYTLKCVVANGVKTYQWVLEQS